jgi:ABC-type glycerol-3-phosphate transport system substrate-binding protein
MRSFWRRASAVCVLVVAVVAAAVAVTSAGAAAPVTVTVWDWGSPPPSALGALDKAYMKSHPGVVIKRIHQPFNSYFTLMRAAMAAHTGPDIYENYASPYVFDYYQGLLPLTKLVTPADRKNLIGWNYVSTGLSNSGTPYAIPWSGQGINFYYNKALFKKAGLNPNSPPKTWAQLLADCAKLKAAGIVPIVAGYKDGYYAEWWTDVLSMQYVTQAQLEASYANPNWTAASIEKGFNLLVSLYKKGYMTPNSVAIPLFPDTVNNFGAGKGAIFLGLSANNANYSEFRNDKVSPNLGAFLAPLVPGSKLKSPVFDYGPGLSWTISRVSKNSTADYTYLSWLANAQSQDQIFKLSGTFPNTALAHPVTSDKLGQQILGWIRQYPTYLGQVTLIRSTVEAIFDKEVPLMMTGQASLSSGLGQVQTAQQMATPIPPTH